jgi:hypothetical protein
VPYRALYDLLPDLARRETRMLIVTPRVTGIRLPPGQYALIEMYCDEPGCDCRRVFLQIQASFRRGPEAVIAWGWESRDFYAQWMGDRDEVVLDAVKGPALNLGSPETELAAPLLELVRELLSSDAAYVARIQEHYRQFRQRLAREEPSARSHDAANRAGSRHAPPR